MNYSPHVLSNIISTEATPSAWKSAACKIVLAQEQIRILASEIDESYEQLSKLLDEDIELKKKVHEYPFVYGKTWKESE